MSLDLGSPFQVYDTFLYIHRFLPSTDIVRNASVCKVWNEFVGVPNTWKMITQAEKIPLVKSKDGKERDYKSDFKILYPRTISWRMIDKYFGTCIGEMPFMSEDFFNKLSQQDPFDKEKKRDETFEYVVIPEFIKRKFGPNLAATVDENGILKITPRSPEDDNVIDEELLIPCKTRNIITLSYYPLAGIENGPVMMEKADDDKFEDLDGCSNKMGIYFMRKEVVGKGQDYLLQEKSIKEKGLDILPLNVRAMSNSIHILKSKECFDKAVTKTSNWTFARVSDAFKINGTEFKWAIGGFIPDMGMRLQYMNAQGSQPNTGAVAGCFPEAPVLEVEPSSTPRGT